MSEPERVNLISNGNQELCDVFREITGADPAHTMPEIGVERFGDKMILRWTGFQVITPEQATELIRAFNNETTFELR